MAASLEKAGLTVFGSSGLPPGEDFFAYIRRGVEQSIAVVVVTSKLEDLPYEAELGMARARSGEGLFFPIVQPGASHDLKRPLQEFQALEVNVGGEGRAAETIVELVARWKGRRHPKLSAYVPTPVGHGLVETSAMRQVEESLGKWLEGDRQPIWVVGRTGSGKTTTLEWARRRFESKFEKVDSIPLMGLDQQGKAFRLERAATTLASQRIGPPALLIIDDLEPNLERAVLKIAQREANTCVLVASQIAPSSSFKVIAIEPLSYSESQRLYEELLPSGVGREEAQARELPKDRTSPLAVQLLAAGVNQAATRERVRESLDFSGFNDELGSSAQTSFSASHVHAMDVMTWVGSAWIPRAIVAGVGHDESQDVGHRARQFEIDGLISLGVLLEAGPCVSLNPYSSFNSVDFRAAASGIDALTDALRSIRPLSDSNEFIPDEMFIAANAALARAVQDNKSLALERAIYLNLETARIMVLIGRFLEADALLSDALAKSSSCSNAVELGQALRSRLARLKMTTGDLDAARSLLLQNLELRSQESSEDPSTLRDLSILADALIESSLWAEAVPTLREVCRITGMVAGQHRASLVAAMSKLAYALERLGNWNEALEVRRGAFELIVGDEGISSSASLTAGADLARTLIGSGQPGEGVLILRDLLRRSREIWGDSDPLTRTIEQNMLLAEEVAVRHGVQS